MSGFYGPFRSTLAWMWRAVVLWAYGDVHVRVMILDQVSQFVDVVARFGR